MTGAGPFIQEGVNPSVLLLWGYISVVALTSLIMTAILGERRRAEEEVKILNAELEERVEERTAELRAAQEELVRKERLAMLGQLTGSVSHELRNPLGAMRVSIAAIKKLTRQEDPLLKDSVAIVDRSITRCDNIVGELLDYSRVAPLNRESTTVDGWFGHLLDEFDAPRGIDVRREFEYGGDIAFDRDRLRRAVVNVLDNAAQAMAAEAEDGGTQKEHVLTVATRGAGGRLEIVIADNGPGITEPNLERIFEPLYSTKNFGVGLGLPLVQRIMEQHGGGIEVGSEAGIGTRVRLWLPLDEARTPAA
jgi:signal transduction histidine kinase